MRALWGRAIHTAATLSIQAAGSPSWPRAWSPQRPFPEGGARSAPGWGALGGSGFIRTQDWDRGLGDRDTRTQPGLHSPGPRRAPGLPSSHFQHARRKGRLPGLQDSRAAGEARTKPRVHRVDRHTDVRRERRQKATRREGRTAPKKSSSPLLFRRDRTQIPSHSVLGADWGGEPRGTPARAATRPPRSTSLTLGRQLALTTAERGPVSPGPAPAHWAQQSQPSPCPSWIFLRHPRQWELCRPSGHFNPTSAGSDQTLQEVPTACDMPPQRS